MSRSASQDLLRSAAGVLVAAGAVVLLARKSGHGWSSLALFLVVLVPALVLYLLALREPGEADGRTAGPAQSVLAVTALLLWPLVGIEFLNWIGASTTSALNLAGVFAITGLLAAAAATARISYAALLAALALLLAWLLVWGKILDHPSPGTLRWLTLIAAALLFAAAALVSLAGARGSSEVAIAGGLAAVGAGVFGIFVGALAAALHAFALASKVPAGATLLFQAGTANSGLQHLGWDVYLLAVSLLIVAVGARIRVRGLGYVGAAGVLAFVISVSAQITRLEAGHRASHDALAWPLVLLGIGAVGLFVTSLPGAHGSAGGSADASGGRGGALGGGRGDSGRGPGGRRPGGGSAGAVDEGTGSPP